jgi:hypothetical protein
MQTVLDGVVIANIDFSLLLPRHLHAVSGEK